MIIISFVKTNIRSNYYKETLELPELLILDEPDASLHPEMSKLLIEVLNETFVKKLGIKVIMTTHSPSTIALCPDNSIYQISNEPDTSLKKVDKDKALKILTDFIPTLSIDYKNHKQVFVESPTDTSYYQMIFNKLHSEKRYPFNLYFISNSYGKGSCEQVIKIVEDIRKAGNKTSYGLVDRDKKNISTDYIKVHGENIKYSIETFVYDPIYLSVLLMDIDAHDIYKELSIEKTFNHFLIGEQSEESLQKVADWFWSKFYESNKTNEKEKNDKIKINYFNGKSISIPKWFLEFQGHDYETRLKKAFAALNKYTGEGQLQGELTLVIGKCYPFIPLESVEVIEKIISAS